MFLSSRAVNGPGLRGDPLPRQQILHSDKAEPAAEQLVHDLDGGVHGAVVDVVQEDDVRKEFSLYMAPLTADERKILADGCLINFYKH